MVFLLYIWIRKLVLKEFCMLSVLYKRQEREFLKECGVKDICYIGVPTLKLIQAARTKVFY